MMENNDLRKFGIDSLQRIFEKYQTERVNPDYVFMFYKKLNYVEIAGVSADGRLRDVRPAPLLLLKNINKEIVTDISKNKVIQCIDFLNNRYLYVNSTGSNITFVFKYYTDINYLIDGKGKHKVNNLNLIFLLHDKTIHVYQYKGGLVNKKTLVYELDLPNIYQYGMCVGNVKWDPYDFDSFEEIEKAAINVFFKSKFTGAITKEQLSKINNFKPVKKEGINLWDKIMEKIG